MMILYSHLSESPDGEKAIVLICQRSSEGERKIKATLDTTLERDGHIYLGRMLSLIIRVVVMILMLFRLEHPFPKVI
jgi:hypothetical protein